MPAAKQKPESKYLSFSHISHSYSGRKVLDDISFEVAAGEIVCLLGPSGCGKTTCLRLASGLERVSVGEITISDKFVVNANNHPAPEERNVGFLLQDYALFPHLNVFDNVAFGLYGMPKNSQKTIVDDFLNQVGLLKRAQDFPHQLSGGEQQRVALARALAPDPEIMLLDEPFSSLDVLTRVKLMTETKELLKKRNVPTLMVTHDPGEAIKMADSIIVINEGKLVQKGTGKQLKAKPANEFVAAFFA